MILSNGRLAIIRYELAAYVADDVEIHKAKKTARENAKIWFSLRSPLRYF